VLAISNNWYVFLPLFALGFCPSFLKHLLTSFISIAHFQANNGIIDLNILACSFSCALWSSVIRSAVLFCIFWYYVVVFVTVADTVAVAWLSSPFLPLGLQGRQQLYHLCLIFPQYLLSSAYVSPFLSGCGCGCGSCRDRLALYFCSDILASPSRSYFALISSRRLCLITGMSLFVVLQPASCCLFFRSSRLGILTFTSFTSYSLAMMMTQQPLILFVYSLSL
jgi:hypothetical protein